MENVVEYQLLLLNKYNCIFLSYYTYHSVKALHNHSGVQYFTEDVQFYHWNVIQNEATVCCRTMRTPLSGGVGCLECLSDWIKKYIHYRSKVWGHLEMSLLLKENKCSCPLK